MKVHFQIHTPSNSRINSDILFVQPFLIISAAQEKVYCQNIYADVSSLISFPINFLSEWEIYRLAKTFNDAIVHAFIAVQVLFFPAIYKLCCSANMSQNIWPVRMGVRCGLVVSVLDWQSRGSCFKSWPISKFGFRFLLHLHRLANSPLISTMTVHCQGEDEMVRTGRTLLYSKAKNWSR